MKRTLAITCIGLGLASVIACGRDSEPSAHEKNTPRQTVVTGEASTEGLEAIAAFDASEETRTKLGVARWKIFKNGRGDLLLAGTSADGRVDKKNAVALSRYSAEGRVITAARFAGGRVELDDQQKLRTKRNEHLSGILGRFGRDLPTDLGESRAVPYGTQTQECLNQISQAWNAVNSAKNALQEAQRKLWELWAITGVYLETIYLAIAEVARWEVAVPAAIAAAEFAAISGACSTTPSVWCGQQYGSCTQLCQSYGNGWTASGYGTDCTCNCIPPTWGSNGGTTSSSSSNSSSSSSSGGSTTSSSGGSTTSSSSGGTSWDDDWWDDDWWSGGGGTYSCLISDWDCGWTCGGTYSFDEDECVCACGTQ
ncbi:MAG: hypothetical protein JST00_07370 [Deltaproteobacteria bacterium]|nr:hypothetical protein [Deltaproteobacteria bacterium]